MTRPDSGPIIDVSFFAVGSCRGPERLAWRGGSWRTVRFPALAVLLRHATRGHILFDTGYAPHYFKVLREWPHRLLGPLLGARLSPHQDLTEQLQVRCGVQPNDVKMLIVSHFHLDHIAGLRDFPAAEIVCTQPALASIDGIGKGWCALQQAFHPEILPADFQARVRPLHVENSFQENGFATWDLLGDETLLAVSLPGHATGQIGLRFTCQGEEYFLVADACWHEAGLLANQGPHVLAEKVAWHDVEAGRKTRSMLTQFRHDRPQAHMIPSHCPRAVSRHVTAATSMGMASL